MTNAADLYASGMTYRQIAEALGCSKSGVGYLLAKQGSQPAAETWRARQSEATKRRWASKEFRARHRAASVARHRVRWTPEMDDCLIAMRKAGRGIFLISEEIGVDRSVVSKRLDELGLSRRHPRAIHAPAPPTSREGGTGG